MKLKIEGNISKMGEAPFISVVVPTCNRTKTLKACIESIAANDYPHYEIIIVDQSSDESTLHLVKGNFAGNSRIIYLHSDIKCSSNARNEGWRHSKGNIVAFTDDDATVDARWLEGFDQAFGEGDRSVGMVGGRVIPVFETPRPAWLPSEKDYLLPSFDAGNELRVFPEESLPMSVNFAVKREALEKTGGFDTRLGLKGNSDNPHIGGEDSFLAKRVKEEKYIILYQPLCVVYHPVTASRLTKRFFLKRNFREGVTAIALENAEKQCSNQRLSSHISWHFNRFLINALFFCKDFAVPHKERTKRYMLRASKAAFNLGAIQHSLYLKKSKKQAGF
jgi:glucosyl-dolichyl phosphate glucuronosyltransferase